VYAEAVSFSRHLREKEVMKISSKRNNPVWPEPRIEGLESRTLFSAITPAHTGSLIVSAIADQKTNNHQRLIITDVSASTITPTLTGPLVGSAIAGQKTNIHEHLTITNTSDAPITETITPSLFLSTGTTIDSSAIALPNGPSKTVTLKPGKRAVIPIVLKTTPVDVPAGTYHLLAQVTDPNGQNAQAASDRTFNMVAPQVDLAGSFITLPKKPVQGQATTFLIKVVNNGNVPAIGQFQMLLGVSTTQTLGAGTPIISTQNLQGDIKPHHSIKVRVNSTPDATGTFFLVCQIDPGDVFHDVNRDNNTFFSNSTITVT
jgi:hypothetical protein